MYVLWGLCLEYMYCAHQHLYTLGSKHNLAQYSFSRVVGDGIVSSAELFSHPCIVATVEHMWQYSHLG